MICFGQKPNPTTDALKALAGVQLPIAGFSDLVWRGWLILVF